MNRNHMQSLSVEVDLTLMFSLSQSTERSGLMILWIFEFQNYRCQKSYHRDNWLVAAKRSQRRRFLILRCRLFLPLSCIRDKRLDCSPFNRERELGLDRRETGQFYPTVTYYHNDGALIQYERNHMRKFMVQLVDRGVIAKKLPCEG